jgi:HD-GYP domain-containing protein (c-di-GMP phosphodiesterase class II)
MGMGQPANQGLRTCLLAGGIASEMGLSDGDRRDIYHLALLRFVGCNSHAHQDAQTNGGDEIAFRRGVAPVLNGETSELMSHMFRRLGEGLPATTRMRLVAGALVAGPQAPRETVTATCEVAQMMAQRLGLGPTLVRALGNSFEQWNGKGMPNGVSGEAIPIAARVVTVARDVDVLNQVGGRQLAEEVLRKRRGRAYDPVVADAFRESSWSILEGIDEGSAWDRVIDADRSGSSTLTGDRLDEALGCFADFADIKCWFTRGHSPAVSAIAGVAASELGLDQGEVRSIAGAALLQELGKTGVPNGILESTQPLTAGQWESIRQNPYLTQRILARCPGLEATNALASAHHERVDGSGYHRGTSGDQLPMGARILAAADAFKAMTMERPWRDQLTPDEAARQLSLEVGSGRLDRDAVGAVVAAAGHGDLQLRSAWPAGLSEREVEVLRLISLGRTNRAVADQLVISPKTVGRHVENIYAKIGVSTRPAATLFAMQHHLIA